MAFNNRQDLADRIEELVRNHTAGLSVESGIVQNEADNAVVTYSQHFPRTVTETLTGDGSTTSFALSSWSTATWVNGYSRIRTIEEPVGNEPPTILDESTYYLHPDVHDPDNLIFLSAPATGSVYVRATVLHSVTDSASTIPANHESAVEDLGACGVCGILSAETAHVVGSTINSDAVNYAEKSPNWRELAKLYHDRAFQKLGVSPDGAGGGGSVRAAAGVVDVDPMPLPYRTFIHRARSQR